MPKTQRTNTMDPRVVHGYICLIGFLPMYVAAGFGVEFPVIGFPELDTTYESTAFVRMSFLMIAALLVASATSEIKKEMSIAVSVLLSSHIYVCGFPCLRFYVFGANMIQRFVCISKVRTYVETT